MFDVVENETTAGVANVEFDVESNSYGIKTIGLFGETLLHVVLDTTYGRKEFVCDGQEGILNHIMLKGISVESDNDELVRVSAKSSYEITENGVFLITLRYEGASNVQKWSIDPVLGELIIEPLNGGLSSASFALTKRENNG